MSDHNDNNSMLYLLAGVGIGAIIGAAAGLLFAPKAGDQTREELKDKFHELKHKSEEWVAEQRAKRSATNGNMKELAEEVGA